MLENKLLVSLKNVESLINRCGKMQECKNARIVKINICDSSQRA